jgi:hypothetical protein
MLGPADRPCPSLSSRVDPNRRFPYKRIAASRPKQVLRQPGGFEGVGRVGVVPRSNHAAIFQLSDLTLVPFDLRTAPLSGCDLVQEGHKLVIASLDQSLEMPSRMDTG